MPRRALVVLRTPMTFFRTVFRVAQVGKHNVKATIYWLSVFATTVLNNTTGW